MLCENCYMMSPQGWLRLPAEGFWTAERRRQKQLLGGSEKGRRGSSESGHWRCAGAQMCSRCTAVVPAGFDPLFLVFTSKSHCIAKDSSSAFHIHALVEQ
jgi:hypothetical protein